MKKFAAIAAASLLLLSVLCFSCSAKLLTPSEVYSYTVPFGSIYSHDSASSEAAFVWDKIEVLSGSSVVGTFYSNTVTRNHANSSNYPPFCLYVDGLVYDSDYFGLTSAQLASCSLVLYGSEPSFVFSDGVSVSGSLVSVPSVVSEFPDSVFSVGSSLLAFVSANWITLLSLVAFLVVLCFGVIRRLVKGV